MRAACKTVFKAGVAGAGVAAGSWGIWGGAAAFNKHRPGHSFEHSDGAALPGDLFNGADQQHMPARAWQGRAPASHSSCEAALPPHQWNAFFSNPDTYFRPEEWTDFLNRNFSRARPEGDEFDLELEAEKTSEGSFAVRPASWEALEAGEPLSWDEIPTLDDLQKVPLSKMDYYWARLKGTIIAFNGATLIAAALPPAKRPLAILYAGLMLTYLVHHSKVKFDKQGMDTAFWQYVFFAGLFGAQTALMGFTEKHFKGFAQALVKGPECLANQLPKGTPPAIKGALSKFALLFFLTRVPAQWLASLAGAEASWQWEKSKGSSVYRYEPKEGADRGEADDSTELLKKLVVAGALFSKPMISHWPTFLNCLKSMALKGGWQINPFSPHGVHANTGILVGAIWEAITYDTSCRREQLTRAQVQFARSTQGPIQSVLHPQTYWADSQFRAEPGSPTAQAGGDEKEGAPPPALPGEQ